MLQIMVGEKVRLRSLEKSDANIMYQWENDPETWKYGTLSAPFSHYQIDRYVEKGNHDIFSAHQLRLMIELISTGTSIGAADLFSFDAKNRRTGIGLLIQKEFRGQGYGYDTLKVLIKYCFETLSLHQLWCNIHESNTKSIQIFEKCGFQLIGIKKDWRLQNNHWENELFFQLINKQ